MESTEIVVSLTALDPANTDADMGIVFDKATTSANGTLTFPANPRKWQSFYVYSKSQVTNVTIVSVKTVYDPITTAPANFRRHWVYVPAANSGNGAWVPFG